MFMMRRLIMAALLCAAATPAAAQSSRVCEEMSGKLNEFILPQAAAPNDPFGRILGTVRGSLQGATTAFLTSFQPSPSGDIKITVNDTFSTEAGNQLFTQGSALWSTIKPGFLAVDLTLAVAGGTGKFRDATGSLHLQGIGNNIAPGTGQFVQEYRGTICYSSQ
jgi:hypothetical protein